MVQLSELMCLLPPSEEKELPESITIQKRIGLFNAVTFTVGSIVGTGIFVTPKGILMHSGSVGMALLVWCLTGIMCVIGALCYIELGTTFPKSGGEFTYLQKCLGKFPAFLYLWANISILQPAGKAIAALTFANYILAPIFPSCPIPPTAVRLIAVLVLCLLTYINCRNMQWVTGVQDVFTCAKLIGLIIIIIAGTYRLCSGNTENFTNAFQGTKIDPGHIALAFYSGMYTFSGWNFLNLVIEELKDPLKNLKRAIYISLSLVTVVYILTNVAYFAVLTPDEILSSNAVAVTFGGKVLGVMSWLMSFSVVLSIFGGLNSGLFGTSRLFFVGAREGHLPKLLSMINMNYLTPTPSLILLCLLSLAYLSTTEVYVLINYVSYVESLFVALAMGGMLWMRYRQPELERPIKVNILLPIAYLLICVFLATFPLYIRPWETGIGIAITLTGIPVYIITIFWEDKPTFYKKTLEKVTACVQKILISVPEEKSD